MSLSVEHQVSIPKFDDQESHQYENYFQKTK